MRNDPIIRDWWCAVYRPGLLDSNADLAFLWRVSVLVAAEFSANRQSLVFVVHAVPSWVGNLRISYQRKMMAVLKWQAYMIASQQLEAG